MNRRALALAALGLPLLLGCGYRGRLLGALDDETTAAGGAAGAAAGPGGAAGAATRAPLPFLLGADVSFLQEQEDQGLT